jgi:exodeoxyribonuclease-1
MASSILWYDLETFGIDSRFDRIAQFACIRTDENLLEVDEPVKLYCRPSMDYLPSPAACKVHGITPQTAWELGLSEYDFAQRLVHEFSRPGTTAAGYNSIAFDDEFIRNLLYRNFFDPYEREYANGNSRWDIINLARAAHDLRPLGIVWPQDGDGLPLFKLEALARANGLVHDSAHDALSDIRATISFARLVRAKQRKLYDWYFSHRRRESLKPLIDLPSGKMLLHTASEYSSPSGCTTLIAPIGMDPSNRNQLIAIDLRFDPEELIALSVDEIRQRVFAKADERTAPRVPLSRIRLNQCPFIAPERTLSSESAARLGLDRKLCEKRLALIHKNPTLGRKMVAVFDEPMPPPVTDDPELCLYSGGFFPDADREKISRIHPKIGELRTSGKNLREIKEEFRRMKFIDDRIPRLLGRFFARNFPETLSDTERLNWRDYCAKKIQLPGVEGSTELADYRLLVEREMSDPTLSAPKRAVIHALLEWKNHLEEELISWGE